MNVEERNELVEANLGLAPYFAHKFAATKMDMDDLVQEAYLGLIDAAEAFDPERGRFSTYARWHILKRIMEAIHNRNDIVRTPRRKPSVRCGSLDAERTDSGASIMDLLEADDTDPAEKMDRDAERAAIRACVHELPWREAVVIRLRHGINTDRLTLVQTAQILGVSRERVRQIQLVAETKLRRILAGCATLQGHGAITAEHRKESAQPEPETDDR